MEGKPHINWNGTVLDRETFRVALAFLKWTHDEHHVEGQARFFYNEVTGEWRTVALPQYIWSGSHTREVEADSPVKEKIIEALLNEGFGEAGTIHHHSNMGAFQSGGDKEDELSRNGFHVTVGTMSSKVAAFHARATFKGLQYEKSRYGLDTGCMNIDQWMPGLSGDKEAPHKPILSDILEHWLSFDDLPEFPEVWKTYMIARPEEKGSNVGFSPTGIRGKGPIQYEETPNERALRLHVGHTPIYTSGRVIIWLAGANPTTRFKLIPRAIVSASTPRCTDKPTEVVHTASTQLPTIQELREMRSMTVSDFETYLELLRESKRVDTSRNGDALKRKMSGALASFRDLFVSEKLSAKELNKIFTDLQTASTRIARIILNLGDSYELFENTRTDLPEAPEMLKLSSQWMHEMTGVLVDLHPEEWDAIDEASSTINSDYDFYQMMCAGLRKAVDDGTVTDVYDIDGEVNYMHVTQD
jgi:hypothetical protein